MNAFSVGATFAKNNNNNTFGGLLYMSKAQNFKFDCNRLYALQEEISSAGNCWTAKFPNWQPDYINRCQEIECMVVIL